MAVATKKVLFKRPKCEVRKTLNGMWRDYKFEDGRSFKEYTTNATIGGRPLLAYAIGTDPETGSMAIADGFVAVGQRTRGVFAVGQFVNGYVSVGQFATGRIAAIGQFAIAPLAFGQLTLALATIAQIGIAGTGVFQFGITYLGGLGQEVLNLGRFLHG